MSGNLQESQEAMEEDDLSVKNRQEVRFRGPGRGRSQHHGLQGLAFLQGTRLWQVQDRSARASRVPSMALVLELIRNRETRGEQKYCHDKMYWEQVGGQAPWAQICPWKWAKI